jgi:hypothetical protein
MNTVARRGVFQRAIGAAKLDIDVYEEVEADTEATGQAAGVVAVVAICAAIGGMGGGASKALWVLAASLFGWLLWSGITYLIGDKLLGGTATWGELLRTIGFAQAPGVLFALGALGGYASYVTYAVVIWILVTGFIAIRQALDFGNFRALLTAIFGFMAYVALIALAGG